MLRLDELLWTSYWFIVTGCIVMVFNTISPLLSLCLTLGCGLLLTSAMWYVPRKNIRRCCSVEPGIGSLVNDKIIRERARLLILTYLASSDVKAVAFSAIRDALDFTAGNLSIQLKTLMEAGYIGITKEFRTISP